MPVAEIAEAWRDGSVVRSWLLDLTAAAPANLTKSQRLRRYASDSGEGRWASRRWLTGVPAPVTMRSR